MATSTLSKDRQKSLENSLIIWLCDTQHELFSQLRAIVHTVRLFTDLDLCLQYIEQIKIEQIFLIISPRFARHMVSLEKQFSQQIHSIYIFSDEQSTYKEKIPVYRKGKGIFTQMESLCNVLKKEIRQLDHDLVPISASTAANSDELNPLFMYFQLLKENLLKIKSDHQTQIEQFAEFRRLRYENNKDESEMIDSFECNYLKHTPIWWYTLESFIYRMLNHALRTVDIDILIKMKFFIQDINEQIKQRHSQLNIAKESFTVYRGQGIFNDEFENLRKKPACSLLSFNAFLSTSTAKSVSEDFARNNLGSCDKQALLFEIKIDPSISSVPFTPIKDLSDVPGEEEILFSMGSIFRIDGMKEIEKGFWKIYLSSTNDNDPLLQRLMNHMRISLGDGDGWRPMAQLMIKMGQWDKAMGIYQMLLEKVDPNNQAENAFLHHQLGYLFKQTEHLQEAFQHYQQALQIHRISMSETDSRLSSVYSNIGAVLKKLGDADEALKYYELVLKIDLAATKPNQLEIAIDHNNIGSVLDDLGKYSDALKSYEEALTIKLALLPAYHPSFASTYSNIGLIHRKMGDSASALSFYEKALEIQRKSLPPNHSSFVGVHGKLATVLEELGRYREALQHAEKAAEIADKAYGSTHPETKKRQSYRDDLQRKI